MTDSINVTVDCGGCHKRLSWPDGITDDDHVICPHCGEDAGRYGAIVEAARAAVADKYISLMKDAFKRH